MACDTPSSLDTFEHQIWNSYLKEKRRYAPDSMQFLETRSEVKFKVIVTQLWYAALLHPKMHSHTKFEIPTSNNIRDDVADLIILKTRSYVKFKVTVIQLWFATPSHHKMHHHTKFETPSSNNIRGHDYSKNLVRGQGHSDLKKVCDTPPFQDAFTHEIWNSYLKE